MRIPRSTTASSALYGIGLYHISALQQHPETLPLAEPFSQTNDALQAARRAREEADDAMMGPRVAVRFSEWALETVIRGIAAAAHQVDGNLQRGPAFDRLFPNGVTPVIAPRGAAQLTAAVRLATTIGALPAGASGTESAASLGAAIGKLEAALGARKNAAQAVAVARATEITTRETWLAHYSSDAGAIRSLFPSDRERRDLYFDELTDSPRRATVADDSDDNGGAGGA